MSFQYFESYFLKIKIKTVLKISDEKKVTNRRVYKDLFWVGSIIN